MKNIIKGFSLLLLTSFLFTSCCKNDVPEIIEPPTPPRTFNYNVPSHDWENYTADWIDLYYALGRNGFGYEVLCHGNTSSAYADFNFDGHQDIMVYSNLADGDDVNKHFLTYDENTENFNISVDVNFIDSTESSHSRKTIVGDFNGDGKPDVVRTQGAHDVGLEKPTITLSNSDNSYTFRLIGDGPDMQSHTVCSGDIDNDGDLDLFFAQSGEKDGFLINDGNANFTWKWISEIIEGFTDEGFLYPDGNYGPYGIWSSEMTDVDKDGYVDLILGGSYKDNDYDAMFEGPTILWGTGTAKFFLNNSTTLFSDRDDLDYLANGNRISLSHDYSVNDIDGDGINDIAIFSDTRNAEDGKLFQVLQGLGNREFKDMTVEWLPDYYKTSSHPNYVWIVLRDIDNNGQIDFVESQPRIHTTQSVVRNSLHWEWNGSSFTKEN
tara:strand:- start:341 stop:1648 length:1308 start_codon:yes stop_codon:yes gene_type:complete